MILLFILFLNPGITVLLSSIIGHSSNLKPIHVMSFHIRQYGKNGVGILFLFLQSLFKACRSGLSTYNNTTNTTNPLI